MAPMPPDPCETKLRPLVVLSKRNIFKTLDKVKLQTEKNNGMEPMVRRRAINDLENIHEDEVRFEYEATYCPPGFTIKELRDCIPTHLFHRSLGKSLAYTMINLLSVGILQYLATWIDTISLQSGISYLLWPVYWWFQGVAGVGIWILAHECGHQAFSDYKTFNNAAGFVLHTLVLVPYHPWRISHSQHHASTGHTDLDQAYVPRTRTEYRPTGEPSPWIEAIESSPIYTLCLMLVMLLFGWPAYFFLHMSGKSYPGRYPTHIFPSSPIFKPEHRWQVIASDIGIVIFLGILGMWTWNSGFWDMAKYYGVPYLIVNGWLVTITLLQHTDVYLPHYSANSWNFVRGALATVDRDYGWFLNTAFHHIHDSHVAHHLFSQMPFYNAIQATPYLKAKLGEYYIYDRTPVWKALFHVVRTCKFVENTGDILFYRNKWAHGLKCKK